MRTAIPRENVDPARLSEVASGVYEAEVFSQQHPEFFGSSANRKAMGDYMREKNLKWNVANLEFAFKKLQEQGKILPPNEDLAMMTASEAARMAEQHGIAQFDDLGRFTGYNWPDHVVKPQGQESRAKRAGRATGAIRPIAPSHPEDLTQKPSRAEWASWGSQRSRDYLEHVGLWGQQLPGDFFRD